MKTKITLIALLLFVSQSVFATDPSYANAMQSQLKALGEASSAEEFQAVANGFDRIAQLNAAEWLPAYYAALAHTNAGFLIKGDIESMDRAFETAAKVIDECIRKNGENAELVALKGYALMGQLAADPQMRGQHLSGKVMATFGHALKLEPDNPRAMILMAQMQLGMAQFFGEGPEKACGMAQKSLMLFEKEKNEEKASPFAPAWGMDSAQALLSKCK